MSDRELLEWAAKAAELTTAHKWNAERLEMTPPVLALVVHRDGELVSTGWDPLNNDSDALRLAVQLAIDFYEGDDDGPAAYAGYFDGARQKFATVRHGDDPYAATRRAIVRAAASIGKATATDGEGG